MNAICLQKAEYLDILRPARKLTTGLYSTYMNYCSTANRTVGLERLNPLNKHSLFIRLKVKGTTGDQNYDGWKVFEKAGPIEYSRLKTKRVECEEEHARRALYMPECKTNLS
jgi:hypothetical protein